MSVVERISVRQTVRVNQVILSLRSATLTASGIEDGPDVVEDLSVRIRVWCFEVERRRFPAASLPALTSIGGLAAGDKVGPKSPPTHVNMTWVHGLLRYVHPLYLCIKVIMIVPHYVHSELNNSRAKYP